MTFGLTFHGLKPVAIRWHLKGCGLHPFFEGGVVLISDTSRGLFIVRPTGTAMPVLFQDGLESGDTSAWSDEGTVNGTGNSSKMGDAWQASP